MRKIAAALVLAASLVTGMQTPTVAQDETPMSEAQAGKFYLTHACKSAAAGDRYYRAVFKGREHIYLAEVKRRLPELTRLSRKYGQAEYVWALDLLHPPAPWPEIVGDLPAKLADRNLAFSEAKRLEGSAQTGAEWIRYFNRSERVTFGQYASQIRARLGLPPPGEGC